MVILKQNLSAFATGLNPTIQQVLSANNLLFSTIAFAQILGSTFGTQKSNHKQFPKPSAYKLTLVSHIHIS